ncbi:hypothetical protein R6Q59_019629, partial [Mikania micrantha]
WRGPTIKIASCMPVTKAKRLRSADLFSRRGGPNPCKKSFWGCLFFNIFTTSSSTLTHHRHHHEFSTTTKRNRKKSNIVVQSVVGSGRQCHAVEVGGGRWRVEVEVEEGGGREGRRDWSFALVVGSGRRCRAVEVGGGRRRAEVEGRVC